MFWHIAHARQWSRDEIVPARFPSFRIPIGQLSYSYQSAVPPPLSLLVASFTSHTQLLQERSGARHAAHRLPRSERYADLSLSLNYVCRETVKQCEIVDVLVCYRESQEVPD